ncbi:hypothetical protein BC831DRAFT_438326 [Entophlyctis helioformis]|nr:hypothetical protein BC831DRAFT_438326 [Entophlyctis helioformis]
MDKSTRSSAALNNTQFLNNLRQNQVFNGRGDLGGFGGLGGDDMGSTDSLSSSDGTPAALLGVNHDKSGTRLPSALARQLQAKLDISSAAVGPNTARQAQLAIFAARRTALLWMEDENIAPRKRETAYSVCRHRIDQWSENMPAATITTTLDDSSSSLNGIGIGIGGASLSVSSNTRKSITRPPGDYEWALPKRFTQAEKDRRELEEMLHISPFFADRNATLTASCIGLADDPLALTWEKRRLVDLMEKERLIPRIFALQREINETSMSIKKTMAEKTELLGKLEVHRKRKEITDTILAEFFMMLKRFNDRRIEAERQAEARRESNATTGSHGLGSSFLLMPKHGGKHGYHGRRALGSHFLQPKHSVMQLNPHGQGGGGGGGGGGANIDDRRGSMMINSIGSSPMGSSVLGSTYMGGDSAGASVASLANHARSRRSSLATGMGLPGLPMPMPGGSPLRQD